MSAVTRSLDPKAMQRAAMVQDEQIGPYLDQVATELHMRLDQWRFHGAPPADVSTIIEVLLALWIEAENRGFA